MVMLNTHPFKCIDKINDEWEVIQYITCIPYFKNNDREHLFFYFKIHKAFSMARHCSSMAQNFYNDDGSETIFWRKTLARHRIALLNVHAVSHYDFKMDESLMHCFAIMPVIHRYGTCFSEGMSRWLLVPCRYTIRTIGMAHAFLKVCLDDCWYLTGTLLEQ